MQKHTHIKKTSHSTFKSAVIEVITDLFLLDFVSAFGFLQNGSKRETSVPEGFP